MKEKIVLKGKKLRMIKELCKYKDKYMTKYDIKYHIEDLKSAIKELKGYLK